MKRTSKLLIFIIVGIIAIIAMIVMLANRPEPIPTNQWAEEGVNCYYDSEGNPVIGWVQIAPEDGSPNEEEWCYFDENGNYVADFDKNYEDETTVLVDISKQMLNYIEDGEIKLTAHIITGTKGKDDTPTGEYSIVSKYKSTRIVGPDWDYDHVCWMGFIGNEYGLHSAWWQDDALFDDPTSYYKHGSHGCVNMREKDAFALFNLVEKGTKVLIQE